MSLATVFIIIAMVALFIILAGVEYVSVHKFKIYTMHGQQPSNSRNSFIKKINLIGLFVALSWLLTIFSLPIVPPIVNVTFNFLPLVLIGFMYGPFYGYIGGILSNLLFTLLGLSHAYFPGYTLSSGIDGAIPGIFMLIGIFLAKNSGKIISNIKIFIMVFLLVAITVLIMGIIVAINYSVIIDFFKKQHFAKPELALILIFVFGSILTLLSVVLSFFFIKRKITNFTLSLIVVTSVTRVLLIGVILNPIWVTIVTKTPLWLNMVGKTFPTPASIFINLFLTVPVCYLVIRLDNNNLLTTLESFETKAINFQANLEKSFFSLKKNNSSILGTVDLEIDTMQKNSIAKNDPIFLDAENNEIKISNHRKKVSKLKKFIKKGKI